jgi:signal transduction histidine kinase
VNADANANANANANASANANANANATVNTPSMHARLGRSLLAWSLLWSLGVAVAVWLAARHEVDELLDDTLVSSAQVLGALLRDGTALSGGAVLAPAPALRNEHFAWQVVDGRGALLQRSSEAPAEPLMAAPAAGFADAAGWRVYAVPLGRDGRLLMVAQTGAERREARREVAQSAVLAALAIGLLGQIWLRSRVRHELDPLRRLAERLEGHDPTDPGFALGAPERTEFQPIHAALDAVGERLRRHVANERAFSAHAAHALRTPLAGIDAQLAVALREAPEAMRPRLERARAAAERLQRVVAALIGLFRSGGAAQRQPLDLVALAARLPAAALAVEVAPGAQVVADGDLLLAALANLLDNASRHGAARVAIDVPAPQCLRVADDGPGVGAERRAALQEALDREDYEGRMGLGLLLADRVARAHGGRLRLPAAERGFVAELSLGAASAVRSGS